MVREQACFTHFEAALNREHPNLILRTLPFAEVKSDSQLLFIPKQRKGISLCRKNFTLETSLSKLPVRISRSCLHRPERLNQHKSSKIAIQDDRKGLRSSKWLPMTKRRQLLNSSTARKSPAAC
jgi:hypothetical protein